MNEHLETISEFGALISCAIDTLESKNSKRSEKTSAVFNIYRMAHEIKNKLKVQNNPATQAIYEELYQEMLKSVDETLNILNKFVSNTCNDFVVSFSIPNRECLVDALIKANLVNKINLLKLKSEFLQIISTYYEEIDEYPGPVELRVILKGLYEEIITEINISTDLIASSTEIKKIIDNTYNENVSILNKHLNFFKRGLQNLANAIEYCFAWCPPMMRFAEYIKQQIGNSEGQKIIHNLKQDFTFFDDPVISPSDAEKTKFIGKLSTNFHEKISQNNDADLEITMIIQKLYEQILYVINNSTDLKTSSVKIKEIIKETCNKKNISIIDNHINLFTLGLELLAETIESCFSICPSMKSLAETIKNDPCSFIGCVEQNKFQQMLFANMETIFKRHNSNEINQIKIIVINLYDQIIKEIKDTDLQNLSFTIERIIVDTYIQNSITINEHINLYKQGLQFLAQAIESCFSFSPIMKNCAESIKYDARIQVQEIHTARDDFSIFHSNSTRSNDINFDPEERLSNQAESDGDIFEQLLI